MAGKPPAKPPAKPQPKVTVTVTRGPAAAKEMARMEKDAAKEKAAKGKRA